MKLTLEQLELLIKACELCAKWMPPAAHDFEMLIEILKAEHGRLVALYETMSYELRAARED